jgi:hypothetical protein
MAVIRPQEIRDLLALLIAGGLHGEGGGDPQYRCRASFHQFVIGDEIALQAAGSVLCINEVTQPKQQAIRL